MSIHMIVTRCTDNAHHASIFFPILKSDPFKSRMVVVEEKLSEVLLDLQICDWVLDDA